MEKISVVIPVYNAEGTIERAVNSVRDQSYPEVEIIAVDDGSADATPEVLIRLQAEIPQLRLIRQENRGVSAARNAGIRAASGRRLLTLDDDDYLHPECLEEMERLARERDCDLVICGMNLVYPDRTETFRAGQEEALAKEDFLREKMLRLYDDHLLTTHSNKLYDLDLIRREGLLYDPELRINEDIDFVFRYLKCCRKPGTVPLAGLNYVQHGTGQSLITTFQKHGVSSALRLFTELEDLFSGFDPGDTLRNGMYHRLLVHVLSFVGVMYYRSPLDDAEKRAAVRELCGNAQFRKLLEKTKPEDLKTGVARFLLRTGQTELYHRLCTWMYRKYRTAGK